MSKLEGGTGFFPLHYLGGDYKFLNECYALCKRFPWHGPTQHSSSISRENAETIFRICVLGPYEENFQSDNFLKRRLRN